MFRQAARQWKNWNSGWWLWGAVWLLAAGSVPAFGQLAWPVCSPDSGRRIVVSLADRKMALIENGTVARVFPVAVGRAQTPSPVGQFSIVNRIAHPTYYAPGVVIEPGPANPLGERWIGLSRKGYGIHGTNAPSSIGRAASHGCIRMAKADLEQVFDWVREGDLVEIRERAVDLLESLFEDDPLNSSCCHQKER